MAKRFFGSRFWGPSTGGGGGGSDPNITTLVVADNGDGTGGVATIGNSTGGATNTLYTSPDGKPLSFTSQGSRTGNGTIALSLAPGTYIGYVVSSLSGFASASVPVEFTLTAAPAFPSATGGAPVIDTKNAFEPVSWCKTPNGDLIYVNGVDQGGLWDGMAPAAYKLGIAAPLTAPVVTNLAGVGGATAGTYNFYYRYVDFLGRPSSLSPVTSLNANNNDGFSYNFSTSPESTRITQIEIWRTISGGSNDLYRVAVLTNSVTSYATDTYTDQALEQQALNDPTSFQFIYNSDGSPDAVRFIPPPTNKRSVVWFQGRAFYGGDVQYTAGLANVVNGSETVVGIGANWPGTFLGRYFYGTNAPRGYEIASAAPIANNVVLITAGVPPTNEVQTISVPAATGGTFTVTLDTHTTGNIAYNASAATVQTALDALPNIGATNTSVTLAGGVYTVTFINGMGDQLIDLMTANGANLSGVPAVVTNIVTGGPAGGGGGGISQEGLFGFIPLLTAAGSAAGLASPLIRGGQFTLSFNGHTTAPINVVPGSYPDAVGLGVPAPTLTAILQALPSIGTGNIQVYGDTQQANSMTWQYAFIGFLQGEALPLITTGTAPAVPSTGVDFDYEGTGDSYLDIVDQITTVGSGGGAGGGGGAGVNAVQQVALQNATGGTFTITTNSFTTAAIAYNASAATVQAALIAACGAGTFSVSSPAPSTWVLTFTGTFGQLAQSLVVVNTTSTTGGAIPTAITIPGSPGVSGVQELIIGVPTSGTFKLTYLGQQTGAIAYNASAATIQADLQALSTIGSGNIAVATTSTPGTFTLTFQGALANSAVSQIIADTSLLVGAVTLSSLTLLTPYLGATASGINYMIRPSPDERNQLYFSEEFEPESVPVENSFKVQAFTNRDDEVVGLAVYGGFMYILMSHHILRYDYSSDPAFDGAASILCQRGVFNKRCWAILDDIAFFHDEEGAYAIMPVRTVQGSPLAQVQPIAFAIEDFWITPVVDYSKSANFWIAADPITGVIHFATSFMGDTSPYPQHALTFNPDSGQFWVTAFHEPMAHGTIMPESSFTRMVSGGASGLIHRHSEGLGDGIDTTTETGTLTGTVTASGANTLTDSTASFTATMVGAPVAITSGVAKGQYAIIQSRTSTQLTLSTNWGVQPAPGDTYLVGAIPWTYQTGLMKYLLEVPEGQEVEQVDQARAFRISWAPAQNTCLMDIRRYTNNNTVPDTLYGRYDQADGLTIADGDVSAVQDMNTNRATAEGLPAPAVGFSRLEFDNSADDKIQADRWVSLFLTGFQCQDRLQIFDIQVEGATASTK